MLMFYSPSSGIIAAWGKQFYLHLATVSLTDSVTSNSVQISCFISLLRLLEFELF